MKAVFFLSRRTFHLQSIYFAHYKVKIMVKRATLSAHYMRLFCVLRWARFALKKVAQRNATRGSWPIGPSHFSDLTSEHSVRRRRKAQGAQLPNWFGPPAKIVLSHILEWWGGELSQKKRVINARVAGHSTNWLRRAPFNQLRAHALRNWLYCKLRISAGGFLSNKTNEMHTEAPSIRCAAN
jgi:hypothetical protein